MAALTCGLLVDHVRESKIVSTTTARKLVVYTGAYHAYDSVRNACESFNFNSCVRSARALMSVFRSRKKILNVESRFRAASRHVAIWKFTGNSVRWH